ncbi:galectin-9-like [Mycteria americana]|uniref:galectin-9-like n=1 Tax=Mycteria americana TaxID=33587 RepID=UPI003F5858ED
MAAPPSPCRRGETKVRVGEDRGHLGGAAPARRIRPEGAPAPSDPAPGPPPSDPHPAPAMDPLLPIVNPSVPFLGYIFGGLSRGRMVIIQGQVLPQAKRFTVALRCAGGDVALQLNPRFAGGPVLGCAARQGGLWGPEQLCPSPPLRRGGALEVIINSQEHGYQVAVNGQHAVEFLHRLPLTSVQALEVTGDVTLACITFTSPHVAAGVGVTALPPPATPPVALSTQQARLGAPTGDRGDAGDTAPPAPTLLSPQSYTPVTISSPGVPFHMALSKGPLGVIGPITIVGTVHPDANRFHANLWSSGSGDVVLHVNPRLREAALVRNTKERGCWGPEERHTAGAMPFQRGQPFQVSPRLGCSPAWPRAWAQSRSRSWFWSRSWSWSWSWPCSWPWTLSQSWS